MGPPQPCAQGNPSRISKSAAILLYGPRYRYQPEGATAANFKPPSKPPWGGRRVDPLPSVSSSIISTSNAAATIALLKITADLFQHAPYVGMVAGLVQEIIKIADDIQNYKDRCAELIDKITSYAHVVFEALHSTRIHSRDKFDNLEADLQHIASVLESIHKMLSSLANATLPARIAQVVQRSDILTRIEEQDRKLDTLITSFQLKTSIILRTQVVFVASTPLDSKDKPASARCRPAQLLPKPLIMFGRDHETQLLVNLVLEHSQAHGDTSRYLGAAPARLSILGPGGIGKTSLALSVFHDDRVVDRFGDNRLFVSCEAATSVEHIISDLAYYLQIIPKLTTGKLLDVILDRLRSVSFLVILDNFETPWELPHARADVEALLQTLAALPTATIIITARGSQHPAGVQWTKSLPPLKPVPLEAATAIFRAIAYKTDGYAIKLVEAVDCLPLAVTLLANLAAVDGETTETLWQRWCNESVGMVETGNNRLSNLDCSIQLSLSSPRMRRDPDALAFLSLLSLLPDGMAGKTCQELSSSIPGIINPKKAVSTLRQNALLFTDSNNSIRMLNPIRLYMITRHPPSLHARRHLQDYYISLAGQGTEYSNAAVRERLYSEMGNIEAMLVDSLESGRPLVLVVEAILAFCHYTYITGVGPSRAITLAVEKLDALRISDAVTSTSKVATRQSRRIGISLLGRFHSRRVVSLPKPSGFDLLDLPLSLQGDCLGCLGQILSRQMRFEEAQEKFRLAIQHHIKAGDIAGHASDLHNLGCLLSQGNLLNEAEAHFKEAIALHEKAGDTAGKAYDIMGYGHVLLQRSQIADAETIFCMARQAFTDSADELGQAWAMGSLAQVSLCRSMFRMSGDLSEQALQLTANLGHLAGQAESLASLACSLLYRSRFGEARQKIENAINILLPVEYAGHYHILGRVLIVQFEYEEARKHLLKARELHRLAKDPVGEADASHQILYIEYCTGSLFDGDQRLKEFEYLFNSVSDEFREAEVMTTRGRIHIRACHLDVAAECLMGALKIYTTLGSVHGQASDLYHLGCLYIKRGDYDLAEEKLRAALQLSIKVESIQGQADAYNKLSEIQLHRQQYNGALAGICRSLALHIQIGDISGQGNDLDIQTCVFLKQSRLDDAENTGREAVELYSKIGQHYNQGRALARLSSILWQKFKEDRIAANRANAFETLDKAIRLFCCDKIIEVAQCHCKRKEMVEGIPHASCEYVQVHNIHMYIV